MLNVFEYFKCIFNQIWRLYNGFEYPLINLSPAGLLFASIVFSVVLFILKKLLGLFGGISLSSNGALREALKNKNKKNKKN